MFFKKKKFLIRILLFLVWNKIVERTKIPTKANKILNEQISLSNIWLLLITIKFISSKTYINIINIITFITKINLSFYHIIYIKILILLP